MSENNNSSNDEQNSVANVDRSPLPAQDKGGLARVTPIVRHCADTYKGCCLPYKTPVMPNGHCVCNCAACGVARYQAMEAYNEQR
jgi:hypothetical protein